MRKFLTVLIAVAALGVATVGTSSTADARWYGGWGGFGWRPGWGPGWGWRGGYGWGPGPFVAGAVVGAALASPYYYGYSPAYAPYPYYGCRAVWNGYCWIRACY